MIWQFSLVCYVVLQLKKEGALKEMQINVSNQQCVSDLLS